MNSSRAVQTSIAVPKHSSASKKAGIDRFPATLLLLIMRKSSPILAENAGLIREQGPNERSLHNRKTTANRNSSSLTMKTNVPDNQNRVILMNIRTFMEIKRIPISGISVRSRNSKGKVREKC